LPLGRVGLPEYTVDGVLQVASLLDLAGAKAAVLTQRSEHKDYLDILALVKGGIALPYAMSAARSIYGAQYNPMLTLKSLADFGDGDLHKLMFDEKRELMKLASETVQALPNVPRLSEKLSVPKL
jgi:hypothetical protein